MTRAVFRGTPFFFGLSPCCIFSFLTIVLWTVEACEESCRASVSLASCRSHCFKSVRSEEKSIDSTFFFELNKASNLIRCAFGRFMASPRRPFCFTLLNFFSALPVNPQRFLILTFCASSETFYPMKKAARR